MWSIRIFCSHIPWGFELSLDVLAGPSELCDTDSNPDSSSLEPQLAAGSWKVTARRKGQGVCSFHFVDATDKEYILSST